MARTSTTSIPQRPSAATKPIILSASRGSSPPGSGQPVPGTNPASITSMSKERYTAASLVKKDRLESDLDILAYTRYSSGHPVPGTKPASIRSMSKER